MLSHDVRRAGEKSLNLVVPFLVQRDGRIFP